VLDRKDTVISMDTLRKIRNRQQARFLTHLKRTGQLTPSLESDVKRAYSYFEQDVEEIAKGNDKEYTQNGNGNH
jgi:hypothetical protein